MTVDLSRIKSSTKAMVVFFLFNMSLTQIQAARDFMITYVFPQLVHHPKLSGLMLSLFGMALSLHSPVAQKMLHNVFGGEPDILAVPGAQMDNVKVVTPPAE